MNSQREIDPDTRKAALYLLRRGWLMPHEIAKELKITRQLVRFYAIGAGIDWRQRRAAFIRRCRDRALNNTGSQ